MGFRVQDFQRWSNTDNYGISQSQSCAYIKVIVSKSTLADTGFPGKKGTKDRDKNCPKMFSERKDLG